MKLILNFRGTVTQVAPDRIEINLPNTNGIQLFNEAGFSQLQKTFLLSNEQMGQLGDRIYEQTLGMALKESIQVIVGQTAKRLKQRKTSNQPLPTIGTTLASGERAI